MQVPESIHRYPRPSTWAIEILCALAILLTALNLGGVVLRALWGLFAVDIGPAQRLPLFAPLSRLVRDGGSPIDTLRDLTAQLSPALLALGLALFASLLLRNAFPTIRASTRGLLVEFAGEWLPLRWETLRALKVTEDLAAERFVLLGQVERRYLTGWHRFYSLIYGGGWQRGFWITSNINEFDKLVQMILSETDRAARIEGLPKMQMQEDRPSPLFRLLLSPAAFFSRRAGDERPARSAVPTSAALASSGPVRAMYPARISGLVSGVTTLLAVLMIGQYLGYWGRFLALQFPALRPLPPFSWLTNSREFAELFAAYQTRAVPFFGSDSPILPDPWWQLVAAHVMLALAVAVLVVLRNILPTVESRDDGLALRDAFNGRWRLIPWRQVRAFKATDISDDSQVLLLQAGGAGLPPGRRFSSMLYDGSLLPGVLLTSALDNFQALVQHALERIAPYERADRPPILQQDAPSWLFWLAGGSRSGADALVHQLRGDDESRRLDVARTLSVLGPMLAIAAPPALYIVLDALLWRGYPPGAGAFAAAFIIWLFGIIEWPVVAVLSVLLDDNTGGGEEGYRAIYGYPLSQLPRLLPLLAGALLLLLGLPLLTILLWLAAIGWAYWLGASFFGALYGWQGSQRSLGGLMPVVYQLLVILIFLVAQRA
jgi:hypothetical protein